MSRARKKKELIGAEPISKYLQKQSEMAEMSIPQLEPGVDLIEELKKSVKDVL